MYNDGVEVILKPSQKRLQNKRLPEVECDLETWLDGNQETAYKHCYVLFSEDNKRNKFSVYIRFDNTFERSRAGALHIGLFTGQSLEPLNEGYQSTQVAQYHVLQRDEIHEQHCLYKRPNNGKKVMEMPCCGDEDAFEGQILFSFPFQLIPLADLGGERQMDAYACGSCWTLIHIPKSLETIQAASSSRSSWATSRKTGRRRMSSCP